VAIPFSISAVERDTGLSKDTLRVWERRYGFPQPERDQFGERIYSAEQVSKLRVLKRLIDAGHRPGKLMEHDTTTLLAMLDEAITATPSANDAKPQQEILELLQIEDFEELRQRLEADLKTQGLEGFLSRTIEPLNAELTAAWMRGRVPAFAERLYREVIQSVLRSALAALDKRHHAPRVLVSSFPDEPDGLGPLIMECVLELQGATCIALGPQAPIADIALAARAQRVDIVALWFSGSYPLNRAREGLQSLRTQLPGGVELWASAPQAALARRSAGTARTFPDLQQFSAALHSWRDQRAAA
jgi:DNA-binding transcriptional MerR regulator